MPKYRVSVDISVWLEAASTEHAVNLAHQFVNATKMQDAGEVRSVTVNANLIKAKDESQEVQY